MQKSLAHFIMDVMAFDNSDVQTTANDSYTVTLWSGEMTVIYHIRMNGITVAYDWFYEKY